MSTEINTAYNFYCLLIRFIDFYIPLFYYCLLTSAGGNFTFLSHAENKLNSSNNNNNSRWSLVKLHSADPNDFRGNSLKTWSLPLKKIFFAAPFRRNGARYSANVLRVDYRDMIRIEEPNYFHLPSDNSEWLGYMTFVYVQSYRRRGLSVNAEILFYIIWSGIYLK